MTADCAAQLGGASDCLGTVRLGRYAARQDVDDQSSIVEFVNTPYAQRYSSGTAMRVNVTTPGQAGGINGTAASAEVGLRAGMATTPAWWQPSQARPANVRS